MWTIHGLTRSHSATAASLGLMDKEDSPGADAAYSNLIQHLNRFLLDSTSVEASSSAAPNAEEAKAPLSPSATSDFDSNPVSKLLRISALTKTTCGACGASFQRANHSHVIDLIYPRKVSILKK